MRAFWKFMGKLCVVALAMVGVLSLLGVPPLWAGLAGMIVIDIACIGRLGRKTPRPRLRRLTRLEPRRLFLN